MVNQPILHSLNSRFGRSGSIRQEADSFPARFWISPKYLIGKPCLSLKRLTRKCPYPLVPAPPIAEWFPLRIDAPISGAKLKHEVEFPGHLTGVPFVSDERKWIMKRNAVLIAAIMFVAGCASGQGQRASYYYDSPSRYDRSDVSVGSIEHIERNSHQAAIPPTDVDPSVAVSHDPAMGSFGSSVSGSGSGRSYDVDSGELDDNVRDTDFEADYSVRSASDFSADSSKRGGSLDARGYDQDANDDELEGTPHPINPGKQADSSIRGGSIFARERDWNHNTEPSSAEFDGDHHMKADSSIRGGSIEARGGREARLNEFNSGTRDDFGQGSSATWQSDKAQGSLRGSANWNASDDLLRDGIGVESQSTTSYELNSDSAVGAAARTESGEGNSSLDDEELNSQLNSDLNSSEQLESNLSGDINLEKQDEIAERSGESFSSRRMPEPDDSEASSTDSYSSTLSSERTTDIHHDEADLTAAEADVNENIDVEAAGTAASSEFGSSSSSDLESNTAEEFESNDPAMNKAGSPLGTTGGEPNFLYQDNRALGIGSAASGDFATSPVNQGVNIQDNDEQLARKVKAMLTQEATGTYGLMSHQIARNVKVSANDGEITLTGTVPTEQDKSVLGIRAGEVSGVTKVNNQLAVASIQGTRHEDVPRGSDLEDLTNELQD